MNSRGNNRSNRHSVMNLFCLKCIEEKENFVCRINKINFFILKLIPTHIYIRMVMSTKARQSTHVQLEMLIVLYYSDRIWIQWISYQCSYRFIVWFLKFTNNQNHVQYEVRLQIQKEKKRVRRSKFFGTVANIWSEERDTPIYQSFRTLWKLNIRPSSQTCISGKWFLELE